MDNLCHTLVGAALGEAGLKRATPLGSLTLMIAANLPDVDAAVFATDLPSVAFRRGWTHGVVAQGVLPVLLASAIYLIARKRGVRFLPLLLLACVGVLSHVYLDLLNNYGVRLLMPFSNRWFYGDAVFIVDIWLWLALGIGVWLARKRVKTRPARVALVASTIYVAALVISARAAHEYVTEQWRAEHGQAPRAVMAGPVPLTPFRRIVIVDEGKAYATGTFTWFPRRVSFDAEPVPKHDDHPAVRAAIANDRRMQATLTWARFPYYEIESAGDDDVVILRDLRFGARVGEVRATVGVRR